MISKIMKNYCRIKFYYVSITEVLLGWRSSYNFRHLERRRLRKNILGILGGITFYYLCISKNYYTKFIYYNNLTLHIKFPLTIR